MKLTLEEAKTKWCCHARVDIGPATAINRLSDGSPAPGCLCIANDCEAWEWEEASCYCNVPSGSRKHHLRGSADCTHKLRGYCGAK